MQNSQGSLRLGEGSQGRHGQQACPRGPEGGPPQLAPPSQAPTARPSRGNPKGSDNTTTVDTPRSRKPPPSPYGALAGSPCPGPLTAKPVQLGLPDLGTEGMGSASTDAGQEEGSAPTWETRKQHLAPAGPQHLSTWPFGQ